MCTREREQGTSTFAHVRAAPDLACVLGTVRVDPTAQLEQARRVPLGWVGDDLGEKVLEALGLQS